MSPKLPVVKPKKLIQALKRSGFVVRGQKGSHVFLSHLDTPEKLITVPLHNKDLKKGTLKGILRQADMSVDSLIKLL